MLRFLFYGCNSASIAGHSPLSMPIRITMRIFTLFLLTGLLAACGQKGALYLPAKPAPVPAQQPAHP